MISTLPSDPRLHELLADRATHGLTDAENAELLAVAARCGLSLSDIEYTEYDLAAASFDLVIEHREQMPEDVKRRLLAAAQQVGVHARSAPGSGTIARIGPGSGNAGRGGSVIAWLAAAACLALATVAWWPKIAAGPADPSERYSQFIKDTPDMVKVPWTDWASEGEGPEIAGVKGDVVWSDAKQKGFMVFKGLPANDAAKQQYQLWIIDGTRGMSQRISGGVFSVDPSTGEVIVPIDAKLPVRKAAAFAITIEQPGGTWVSDMKRRVVIAPVKG